MRHGLSQQQLREAGLNPKQIRQRNDRCLEVLEEHGHEDSDLGRALARNRREPR